MDKRQLIAGWMVIFLMATYCFAQDAVTQASPSYRENKPLSENKSLEAKAQLYNPEGEKVGFVSLEEATEGVRMIIKIDKLPPGLHAFHIHEKGNCNPPEFKTAGGHFNPKDKEHGFLNPKGPHAGDLPNIAIDKDGTAEIETITKLVSLKKEARNSLLKEGGTSIVIHQGPDDYITNPAGSAGPRIACGVIEEVK